jgi:hypothetical protein
MALVVAAFAVVAVVPSVAIPRFNRPAPLYQPKSFSMAVPDGYRRCWASNFSVAIPEDWHRSNEHVGVQCRFADPEPFEVADGKKTPSTAFRISDHSFDLGADGLRTFKPYNYPETLNELTNTKYWTVKTKRGSKVPAGVPTWIVETVAKRGGYYEEGTRFYASIVAAEARLDKRCAGYFVHCSPFIISTHVGPDDADEFDRFKDVVEVAARTLRFFKLEGGTDRRSYLAVQRHDPPEGLPVRRVTAQQDIASKRGMRTFLVRVYRGARGIDRYSDDIVVLRGDEPYFGAAAEEGNEPRWKVESWERGPEYAIGDAYGLKVYLPTKGACDEGRYRREGFGLSTWFKPGAVVGVTRTVPKDDVLPGQALFELRSGPTESELMAHPSLVPVLPKGVRLFGGYIQDGRTDVSHSGRDYAGSECQETLRHLAASKTLRQFPSVKSVGWASVSSS